MSLAVPSSTDFIVILLYASLMPIQSINSNQIASLVDFLADPLILVDQLGSLPLAILSDNKAVFYVFRPQAWDLLHRRLESNQKQELIEQDMQSMNTDSIEVQTLDRKSSLSTDSMPKSFEKQNNFNRLSEQLLDAEWERVSRGELSAASVGIQKNRLDAHVLPFFRYVPPTQITHLILDDFVSRLTQSGLSTTTISQYLVLVRKLLKLAVRKGLLREIPEFPRVKIVEKPRSMLTLHEYFKLARTALRMTRTSVVAPPIKSTDGQRDRFWVAQRNMLLAPDMFWVIRFMVNSFVRPGDLRELKHKHVTVVRGDTVYLRLKMPRTKKHDAQMVTMQSAVHVYESVFRHHQEQGYGGLEDYVFLPAEKDREYALAVLGFWFKWVMREAGLDSLDELERPRTLYCLRHTSIMFRLLYGQGIDMLTLARNARTSVQMIERFYASSLDGEMNVDMLQSRRQRK